MQGCVSTILKREKRRKEKTRQDRAGAMWQSYESRYPGMYQNSPDPEATPRNSVSILRA